jgi:hypothetical protein
MLRTGRNQLSLLAGLATILVSGIAAAQAGAAPPAGGGGEKKDGYGYEFSDDPLNAGGFGPNDATIRVRPGPVRMTLIRPRTSFVPEMLKSVENL